MSKTVLLTRAAFLRTFAATTSLALFPRRAHSQDVDVTPEMVFRDPEAPTAGNPDGDLTILDFFDYNCPYCKASAPHLEQVVRSDGNIRLCIETGQF